MYQTSSNEYLLRRFPRFYARLFHRQVSFRLRNKSIDRGISFFSSRDVANRVSRQEKEHFYPNRFFGTTIHRTNPIERILHRLMGLDRNNENILDEAILIDRQIKAIKKGDPREFMG